MQEHLAGIIEDSEEQIREGVRLLYAFANLKAEPTAALPIGALLAAANQFRDREICCVVSGGNADAAVYRACIG